MKKIINIFFDLDGTLYSFDTEKFKDSSLKKDIHKNIYKLITKLKVNNPEILLQEMEKEYWEDFSIAFEKNFNITKDYFFSETWNNNPKNHIKITDNIKKIFKDLNSKWYCLYIVSDAPKIWIDKVIKFLWIKSYIKDIFSWEWDNRKSNWKLYEHIKKVIFWKNIMVGDQEFSDIIQAKKYDFIPIFISRTGKISKYAKFNIKSLEEIYKISEII